MLFIQQLFTGDPMPAIIQIVVVIFSVCCHEYSHAQMALWQGDSTAADQGHLTLNPMKQMGPMSLLMLVLVGIAWGQVPVTPSRMRNKYSSVLVDLAGPLMNLLLFFFFTVAFVINIDFANNNAGLNMLFSIGAIINGVLFILNMLPIPPLDGGNMFRDLLTRKLNMNSEFVKGTIIFLVFMIFVFSKYLFLASKESFIFFAKLVHAIITITGVTA